MKLDLSKSISLDEENIRPKLDLSRSVPLDQEDIVPQSNGDVPDSPLNIGERARLGFGNQAGSLDYLQKQGKNAEYKDGELFVDNKQADPSAFSALGDIAGSVVNPFRSLYKDKEAEQRRKNILTNLKDIPADIAESPSDIINAGLTSGGAALGSLTGPGAIVASPAGGAAGGLAAEKIKEEIGNRLGVYKTEGEFLTPEAKSSAAWGTLAGLPQVIQQGRKGVSALSSKMKGLLKSSELPEKVFANATGLGDTLLDEPEVVRSLLKDNVKGSAKDLRKFASQKRQEVGRNINKTIGDKTFDFAELEPMLPKAEQIASEVASGERQGARSAANRVLNEFKDKFLIKESKEVPSGIMNKPSYEEFKKELIKSSSPFKVSNAESGASVKNKIEYLKQLNRNKSLPPSPTEEDISRLYQQIYPENDIKLPSKIVDSIKKQKLLDLNEEKSLAANASSRVYESEGAKGTAKQKTQKELADTLRNFIEDKVEGIRPINQKYHVYDTLEKGVEKVLNKDYKGNPLVQGGSIRNWLANLALGGTTGGKTRVASSLYKYANKPAKEVAKNPSLFSQAAIQAIMQSLKE